MSLLTKIKFSINQFYEKFPKEIWIIFAIALLVRIIALGAVPLGFHSDEVRAGWNAFSFLKTGSDDWGNTLPLYYNTFGDYRPIGIFYLTIPSLLIFGLSEFSVRFLPALIGSLTIFPLYSLAILFNPNKKTLAILSAVILAFSPWHIATSRATSEVVVSLFLTIMAMVYFIKAVHKNSNKYFLVSTIFFVVSFFFYHTARVLTPLFIVFLVLKFPSRKTVTSFLVVSLTGAFLLLGKQGQGRFSQVSIFNTQRQTSRTGIVDKIEEVKNEYLRYVSFDFLSGSESRPMRYKTGGVGILSMFVIVSAIYGIIVLRDSQLSRLPLIFLLLSPLPAAITREDSPNLHRALYMLPFIAILAGYGISSLIEEKRLLTKTLAGIFIFTIFSSNLFFITRYFFNGRFDSLPFRNEGVDEVVVHLNKVSSSYDSIYITNEPDSPYPWLAFKNAYNPKIFNQQAKKRKEGEWRYENFVFTNSRCPAGVVFDTKATEKTLVVNGPNCSMDGLLDDHQDVSILLDIKGVDGKVLFTFLTREKDPLL